MEPGTTYYGAIDFTDDSRVMALTPSRNFIDLYDTKTNQRIARLESPDQVEIVSLSFSSDGGHLVAACNKDRVQIWDLRELRRRLRAMRLDWDAPPIPPEHGRTTLPLTITFNEPSAEQRAQAQIADYADRVKANPKDADAQNGLAWFLVLAPERLREPQRAVAHARTAVELGGAYYLNTLGSAYYRTGEYTKAIAILNESLQKGNGESDAFDLFFLAMVHQRLAEPEKARLFFDRAIKWWESKPKLQASWVEDLTLIRAEAEATLGLSSKEH